MSRDLIEYLNTVWGLSRPDAFLEVSARVNGAAGSAQAQKKKAGWKTQHVRLGDLLGGGQDGVQPLLDLAAGEQRVDLYLGCMPLSAPPEGGRGRGKGDLRESVPGIWFDIDAQAPGREASAKGEPLFETPEKALEALDEFCAERGVRAGVVTDSGWGLHAWILFAEGAGAELIELVRRWNVDFADWCKKRYGIHVDVVADKTRVLRIPDTVNWRKADNLDEAAGVRVLRLESEMRFGLVELGWTPEIRAEIEERRKAALERLARGIGSGGGMDGEGALFSGAAALDACSWAEILQPFGWRAMDVEGSNEIARWGRPRTSGTSLPGGGGSVSSGGSGGEETSSAVVFADAPWVLVVFSEAAGLPSWQEVRIGGEKPNTKWRTWVRLAYDGDEIAASAHAVTVALHGYPRHWPATAASVLASDGQIFRAWQGSLTATRAVRSAVKAGVGAA